MERLPERTNVLDFWKARKENPKLATLARQIMSVQASSVASERVFSAARHIITDDRNRLGDNTTEALVVTKFYRRSHYRTKLD